MKAVTPTLRVLIALMLACGDDNAAPEGRNAGECSDGADNDGDGAFDCDDSDCLASPACVATDAGRDGGPREGRNPGECTDGADNDGDGAFDCADTDCIGAPACIIDAGQDGMADVPTDVPIVVNGCEGAGFTLPSRPAGADTSGDEQVIGLHEPLLRQDGGRWRTIGRNLDGLCSLAPSPLLECQPRDDALPPLDGEAGIDNVFGGAFFELVSAAAPALDNTAREASTQGTGTIVLRVRGYNGEADDPRVEVAVLQSVYGFAGTSAETEPSAHQAIDFGAFELDGVTRKSFPTWDGNDWLFPRADAFLDGNLETPVVVTNDAYVAGGVLVIPVQDDVPFNFASAMIGISVTLTDARLVVGIGEGNEMSGRAQLSGRWRIREILESVRTLGACPGSPEHEIFARQIDRFVDVLSRRGDDNTTPCDAMSVGIEWNISSARLGALVSGAQLPNLCE